MPQPTITSNDSVIVRIGIVSNGQRSEIVMPFGVDGYTNAANNFCKGQLHTTKTQIVPLLQDCLSEDAYISFIEVNGMIGGKIPAREDYVAMDIPGTRTGVAAPNQVAALAIFRGEPLDMSPGAKLPEAKNFLAGISIADIVQDVLVAALVAAIKALAAALVTGVTDTAGDGTMYRARRKEKDPGVNIKRTSQGDAREVVKTQRRRLSPV